LEIIKLTLLFVSRLKKYFCQSRGFYHTTQQKINFLIAQHLEQTVMDKKKTVRIYMWTAFTAKQNEKVENPVVQNRLET